MNMENRFDYPVPMLSDKKSNSSDFGESKSKGHAEVASIELHEDGHQRKEKEVFADEGSVNFKTLPW